MNDAVSRRELLVLAQRSAGVGACVLALGSGGCAVLKGGASHPVVPASELTGNRLRIPVAALASAQPGSVLEVKPGGGKPDLLLLAPPPGGSWQVITAHCTHKGCVVEWDAAGAEWKCPCHGSRYGSDGHVVDERAVA